MCDSSGQMVKYMGMPGYFYRGYGESGRAGQSKRAR